MSNGKIIGGIEDINFSFIKVVFQKYIFFFRLISTVPELSSVPRRPRRTLPLTVKRFLDLFQNFCRSTFDPVDRKSFDNNFDRKIPNKNVLFRMKSWIYKIFCKILTEKLFYFFTWIFRGPGQVILSITLAPSIFYLGTNLVRPNSKNFEIRMIYSIQINLLITGKYLKFLPFSAEVWTRLDQRKLIYWTWQMFVYFRFSAISVR